MELEEAQKKLKAARKRGRKLREEINMLRDIIWEYGIDPDDNFRYLIDRNKEIYKRRAKGATFNAIGKEFNLSGGTISTICTLITRSLIKKGYGYDDYKSLARYKGKMLVEYEARLKKRKRIQTTS